MGLRQRQLATSSFFELNSIARFYKIMQDYTKSFYILQDISCQILQNHARLHQIILHLASYFLPDCARSCKTTKSFYILQDISCHIVQNHARLHQIILNLASYFLPDTAKSCKMTPNQLISCKVFLARFYKKNHARLHKIILHLARYFLPDYTKSCKVLY